MPKTPMIPGLTDRQALVAALFGAVLWLCAALLLRALIPLGIHDGLLARVVLYAAIVPGTWPFVVILRRVAGLQGPQVLTGVTVTVGVAVLLDGLALSWAPWLYGQTPAHIAGAGAAILWGAGVALGLGALASRKG